MTSVPSTPAARAALLPRPTSLDLGTGELVLDAASTVAASGPRARELGGVLTWLQGALRPATGLPLREATAGAAQPATIDLAIDDALPAEGFVLSVDGDGARVRGGAPAGVFYGCQALRQLLPPAVFRAAPVAGVRWALPHVEVADSPRFAWRGLMLDVARHFVPVREVLRAVDLAAAHRLNVLHLHLTDDQGWRFEVRRAPRLTEVGGWRRESQVGAGPDAPGDGRPHGGYYTQDDCREIVAHAAARFVTVVPEIETPGHVRAALAAHPELGVGWRPGQEAPEVWTRWGIATEVLNCEESTVDFFTGVLDEVMEVFPSPFVGIGGDECPRDAWRADARTQERMRELGLTREADVQTWFTTRLDAHLTAHGRRAFGWDEILEGDLAQGAVVASWRGMVGAVAAARRGHDVVACPDDQAYLDYRQSERDDEPIPVSIPLTVADVYAFDPVPPSLTAAEAAHVLGGQGNLWTEHADSPRTLDYLSYPRVCALAEALWSGPERDLADFEARLAHHVARLDAAGVERRHDEGPRPWQTRPGVPGRPATREEREAHMRELTTDIAPA